VLTLGEDNYDTRIRFVERPCAGRALWKTKVAIVTGASSGIGPRGGKKAGRVWLPRGRQLTQHTSANSLDGTGDLKLVDGDIEFGRRLSE